MEITISLIALILCWIWIESIVILSTINNNKIKKYNNLSLNKFRWILRIIIILLFFLVIIYMFYFENEKLRNSISFCLNVINIR